MNHDILAEPQDATTGDNLITIGSEDGARIEMTRTNHRQLEREMARMLDNPLDALMERVVLEYLQMAAGRENTDIEAA